MSDLCTDKGCACVGYNIELLFQAIKVHLLGDSFTQWFIAQGRMIPAEAEILVALFLAGWADTRKEVGESA